MQEAGARQTFEALFRYMGEEFGAYKTRVSNWTLGNEVNSCKEWNYSGGMSLKECVSNYAQAFQLLSKGVKRAAKSSRLFISLDHCWTASVAGHRSTGSVCSLYEPDCSRSTVECEFPSLLPALEQNQFLEG